MDTSVDGKRVVVTAGGSGAGRVIAETFDRLGARVHVCDVNSGFLDAVRAANPGIGATLADVGDPAAVDALFDAALAHLDGNAPASSGGKP